MVNRKRSDVLFDDFWNFLLLNPLHSFSYNLFEPDKNYKEQHYFKFIQLVFVTNGIYIFYGLEPNSVYNQV